jgi:hypothetical protein
MRQILAYMCGVIIFTHRRHPSAWRVAAILDNNLDRRPARQRSTDGSPILHANIRGPRYYN